MYDLIDFDDLQPAEVPVKISGKNYILKEASGGVAVRYRNALMKATKIGDNMKITSIDGIADAEPLLVSLCLFEVTGKGLQPVSVAEVRAWPNRVQKALFERIKEISDLDLEEKAPKEPKEPLEERVKNELSATTDGSA